MKLKDLFEKVEAGVLKAFAALKAEYVSPLQTALKLSTAFLAWLKTKPGTTVEEFVAANIPQGEKWTEQLITIVTDMAADAAKLENPDNWNGVALMLAGKVFALVHGSISLGAAIQQVQAAFEELPA